jgi:predicted phosphodiesterase
VNRIYGNHDFENRHFQGYQLNYLQGKIYLEHGFAADSWQANPAAGLLWEISSIGLLAYRDLNEFFNKIEIEAGDLQKDRVFSWSVTSGKNPRKDMTPETDYLKDNGDIKNYYCNRLINRKNSNDCKISIIGHTHHPYIDKNVQNGNFMYIDAGGWTEGRSDFVVATDEEIAICHYKRDSEII